MEQEKASFDIHKYVQLLLRRKWLCIATIAIIGIGTIVYALNKQDIYESQCILVVDEHNLLSDVLSTRRYNVRTNSRQMLQTVSERMLAWEPVTNVIREVGLDKEFPIDDLSSLEKLYYSVIKNVSLTMTGDKFIKVSYRGTNPEVNFGIINGLVSSFMEKSLEAIRNDTYDSLKFIDGDLQRLKNNLDESEKKFRKFEEEHIEELPGTENSILPKLYAAKNELVEVDREIAALKEKLNFVEGSRGMENETITGEIVQIPNPKLNDLKNQITGLEIEITKLRAKYHDEYPRIIMMRKELVYLEELLEEESEKVVTEEKIVNNPRYEGMIEREFEMRLELKSLQSHRGDIESEIKKYIPTLDNIPALKQQLFELQMDYDVNKKLYEERLVQRSKVELAKEMSLNATNSPFEMVQPPRISYEPVKMVKIKTIMMGFLMGIGLAIGLVFGLDQIDPRFKTMDELQEYLQIPALGAIPTIITKTDIKRKIRKRIIMAGIVASFVTIAITVFFVVKPVKDVLVIKLQLDGTR